MADTYGNYLDYNARVYDILSSNTYTAASTYYFPIVIEFDENTGYMHVQVMGDFEAIKAEFTD